MKALVTGGGGFLGGALVRRLLAEGVAVRSLARGRYPDLEGLGVECIQGDLVGENAASACSGCDVVFHAAAKVGLWGPYSDYHRTNVAGTRHLVDACRATGVRRLVFTGSPSVVFNGGDVEGWDESASYPRRFDSYYSRTKALAEEIVLASNGPELAAISLRPHLVWGPGDRHIAPRLIAQARAGVLRRIGGVNKRVDTTFIDDAVEAHWLAAKRLEAGAAAGGRAYFISSGDPRPLWDIINGILAAAGEPPVTRQVPLAVARATAWSLEGAYRLFGISREPRLTRFLVSQLTTAHWFDIGAARRDLGYRPRVTIEEGMARLKASL